MRNVIYGEHSAFNGDFDPNSSLSGYNGMGGSHGMYFANNDGGGFATGDTYGEGPDNNPKSGTWQSVKNFFRSIFGDGKKSSGSLVIGDVESISAVDYDTDTVTLFDFDDKIGLPAKKTILGKILSIMSPREWEDSHGRSYQVNSDGRITNIAPLMGDVPFGLSSIKGGYNMTSTAVRSALTDRIGKRGFLEVGYQFQKHFGRGGNWAIPQGLRQNPAMFNLAGYDTFKEIWRSPGSFQRIGGFIEKRLPDGRGIRLQENWKFKGFLD